MVKRGILSETISIRSFDDAQLAGILEVPRKGVKALVIPVHGSFAQTRDGSADNSRHWMFPNPVPERQLFLDFRSAVLPLGVGLLRYDKRASGFSEGIWAQTDFHAIARDLLTIVQTVRARFPRLRVGVMGQSEGCLTCLKAIDMGASVDFFISQAGALETYISLIDRQKSRAAAPFLAEPNGKVSKKYPLLATFYRDYFEGGLRAEIISGKRTTWELKGHTGWIGVFNLDLFRQYDTFSALEVLKKFPKPSLLMNGTKDLNVPPTAVEYVRETQAKGKSFSNVRCEIMKDLEHSFRKVGPNENFFDAMKKPIDPQYRRVIQSFLKGVLSSR